MLVMLTEGQLFPPHAICQSCLLADQDGQPRWHQGSLCCGRLIPDLGEGQPAQFECKMGFRVASIE